MCLEFEGSLQLTGRVFVEANRQKMARNGRLQSIQGVRALLTMSVLGGCVLLLGGGILLPTSGASAQSADLPEGPGKAFAVENCSACHGLEIVTAQRRSSDEWQEVVNRMITNGDDMTEDQYTEVVAYLGTYLGTEPVSGVAPTSASNIEDSVLVARSAGHDHKK